MVVLGAFRNGELGAVGVTKLVANTLVYSTAFCNTESLKSDVTSLMLHSLRAAAAGHPMAKQIYVGNYKFQGGKGIDEFYFARGCKLVWKPAVLHINPISNVLVRYFMPVKYTKLVGNLKDALSG